MRKSPKDVRKTMSPKDKEYYYRLQADPRNTLAYKTIRFEWEQYALDAAQARESVMSYAEWLEKYRGVCQEGVDMLTNRSYYPLEDINQFIY